MLVGDPDQLPPVGAGQPVADALAEGLLPCIDLRQIYRTAANSAIVTSAHAINRGEAACVAPLLACGALVLRPAQRASSFSCQCADVCLPSCASLLSASCQGRCHVYRCPGMWLVPAPQPGLLHAS